MPDLPLGGMIVGLRLLAELAENQGAEPDMLTPILTGGADAIEGLLLLVRSHKESLTAARAQIELLQGEVIELRQIALQQL